MNEPNRYLPANVSSNAPSPIQGLAMGLTNSLSPISAALNQRAFQRAARQADANYRIATVNAIGAAATTSAMINLQLTTFHEAMAAVRHPADYALVSEMMAALSETHKGELHRRFGS